jgi:hypothetical protein
LGAAETALGAAETALRVLERKSSPRQRAGALPDQLPARHPDALASHVIPCHVEPHLFYQRQQLVYFSKAHNLFLFIEHLHLVAYTDNAVSAARANGGCFPDNQ